jgi:LuxR family glucitol operon transcriptional activator
MSSRTFATRMTCFSLISAVETDVRRVISVMDSVCDLNIPIDVKTNAEDRYQSHFGEKACTETPLGELIEFSDFSDLSKIISTNYRGQNKFKLKISVNYQGQYKAKLTRL